jgi:hypothetical protein
MLSDLGCVKHLWESTDNVSCSFGARLADINNNHASGLTYLRLSGAIPSVRFHPQIVVLSFEKESSLP